MTARFNIALAIALVTTIAVAAPARAAGPPQVHSAWVTEVTTNSVNVRAEVNPGGLATTVRIEYIDDSVYAANLAANPPRDGFSGAAIVPGGSGAVIGSAETDQVAIQHIGGLKAATAYDYRVVASNSAETVRGGPHLFTTEETAPVFSLPDSRGWEMVSPVDKNGGRVDVPEADFGGGVFQAAAQGGAVTYGSASSFGATAGSPGASQYLSRRGGDGWGTENITVSALSGSYDDSADAGVPYQLFSGDLAAGLLSNGRRCRSAASSQCPVANPPLAGSGAPAGYRNYYLRDSGGAYRALLGAADVATSALGPADFEVAFVAASANLGQVVLSSCAALTDDANEVAGTGGECDPAKANLYRWSGSGLSLVNLLPGQGQGTPGAALAAQSGAVSADGSRVYWVDTSSGNLYLRTGAVTTQVDGAPEVGGGGEFQATGADGAIAFFTKAGHLYRYLASSGATTDLTPGGEVEGVLGASADGTRLYYLTATGLYLWQGAASTRIAAAADLSNTPPATGAARVSADGSRLAFISKDPLTGYDNNGRAEVYLYNATAGTLLCASCNPTGERPLGPSTIPAAVANGAGFRAYKPRALAADGSRLFFDSGDALAPQDTNGDPDVYEWEAAGSGDCRKPRGCIGLISSGRSEDGARFIDASADGADVFFTTDGSLVAADPGSVDLYDARVGGGFPTPPAPIPCVGDACQILPAAPEDPSPGTLFSRPAGNPPLSFPKAAPKKRRHHRKHHARHSPKRRHGQGRSRR